MLGSRDDRSLNAMHQSPSQGSEASLIVLTTHFHGVSPIKLQD